MMSGHAETQTQTVCFHSLRSDITEMGRKDCWCNSCQCFSGNSHFNYSTNLLLGKSSYEPTPHVLGKGGQKGLGNITPKQALLLFLTFEIFFPLTFEI